MHTEPEQKQNLEGRAEQQQDLGTGTETDRSIDTYYELLRSGKPLSELLSELTRNSNCTTPLKSDFAVQFDVQKQEIDTNNEPREYTAALLGRPPEHIEPVQCHEPQSSLQSEISPDAELIEPRRPSAYWRRFGGRMVAAAGGIGICLYPPLTNAPSSDGGALFQANGEQGSILLREKAPGKASGEPRSPVEAASAIVVPLSQSPAALTTSRDISSSTVPAPETQSPSPPPTAIVGPASTSTTTAWAGTVEVKSDPPGLSTPADEPALAATATSSVSSIAGQMTKKEITALVSRGDELLVLADVVSARLFYERAANAGDALAALRLGESYDPSFLARARLAGMRAQLAKAAYWYRYAHGLGLPEANVLLGQLEDKMRN